MLFDSNKKTDDDEETPILWWTLFGFIMLGGLFWFISPADTTIDEAQAQVQTTIEKNRLDSIASASAKASAKPKVMPTENTLNKAELGEFEAKKLSSGIELNIPALGIESKLLKFIEDKEAKVSKDMWFDFDRLLFETGKSTLQPASQEQLTNIAQILKAYPEVEIKIGGYSDNVGDPKQNQQLSQVRADAIKAELAKLEIDAKRIQTEGYGDKFPVGDNNTEEGRSKNRRVSVRVTKK